MTLKHDTNSGINGPILKKIEAAIEELSFGTVTITVHNKRITQIETAKKQRFDDFWKVEEGGGI